MALKEKSCRWTRQLVVVSKIKKSKMLPTWKARHGRVDVKTRRSLLLGEMFQALKRKEVMSCVQLEQSISLYELKHHRRKEER